LFLHEGEHRLAQDDVEPVVGEGQGQDVGGAQFDQVLDSGLHIEEARTPSSAGPGSHDPLLLPVREHARRRYAHDSTPAVAGCGAPRFTGDLGLGWFRPGPRGCRPVPLEPEDS